MTPTVAVVGVGNMGLAMALRLRDAGFAVRVRDVDPSREALAAEAGASVHPTPVAAARDADAAIVAVVDATQCEAVLFGAGGLAADASTRGAAVVLCPTIGPASVESIAGRLATTGLDLIEAPMSGGPVRARDGTMSLMVVCDDAVHARHRPLLDALSSQVVRLGARPGDAARTKLVNNLLAAVNLAATAEAIALAERVGLDPERTLDVIERSSGQSWIGSDRMRRALAGDFAPRAHTTLLAKDSRLAMEMASAAGGAPPLGAVAAELFAKACAQGFAELDDASLLMLARAIEASDRAGP